MKNLIVGITCAVLGVSCLADEAAATKKAKLSPEEVAQRRAQTQEAMLKRTGGMVLKPGTLKGEVVIVNCQKSADKKWLSESAASLAKDTKFKVTLADGAFDIANPVVKGNVSVFVIEDEKLPMMLVAPESRWAAVNVAPLKKGAGEKPAFFEARTRKVVARAMAHLCGGVGSQFPYAVTGPITKVEDLDQNPEQRLPVDVMQRFRSYMPAFGVSGAIYLPYRLGCREGWAAQPTNDYQKAIWDEVHTLPTDPIRIKPESQRKK